MLRELDRSTLKGAPRPRKMSFFVRFFWNALSEGGVAPIDGFPPDAANVAGTATLQQTIGRMRGRISPPKLRGCAMQQWQGPDTIFSRLGKAFHLYADDIAHEPLPMRWVELIRYLDEQERRSSEQSQRAAGGEASRAETEHAVTTQEKLLRELMRTEEPTEEATAVLEDLRRKVARAVAARN